MDLAEADAARDALIELESAYARGEPVTTVALERAHARYTEAEKWRSEQDTAQRRAEQQAQGIVPGPDQGIGLGS